MRLTARGVVLLIASVALLGSATVHGIVNVPHLREDLIELGVRQSLVGAIMLVLYFSVVAMVAFGGLVLSGAAASMRGHRTQQAGLWIVALTYVVFGVVAFLLVNRSVHMLGYSAMGTLVAVGAMLGQARAQHGRRTA